MTCSAAQPAGALEYLPPWLLDTCQLLVDKWLGAERGEAGGQARRPRVVMEAMRHCDLKLTMRIYTDVSQLPLAACVRALPSFKVENSALTLPQNHPLKIVNS